MARITAGYVRVSTDGQAEHGLGLETQRARITAYCQSQGWPVDRMYEDAGFSGAELHRHALDQLLLQVETGTVERVVVYKLDRLSRRLLHLKQLVDEAFLPHHTALVSVTEPLNTETPAGRLFFHLLGSFAEFERDLITERLDGGRRTRAAQGKKAQGYAPLGYTDTLAINPKGAALVKRIFTEYLTCGSLGTLTDRLSTDGIYSANEKPYTRATLAYILKNRFYLGEVHYGDVTAKGTHPPIITPQLFGKVRAALTRNRRNPGRRAA